MRKGSTIIALSRKKYWSNRVGKGNVQYIQYIRKNRIDTSTPSNTQIWHSRPSHDLLTRLYLASDTSACRSFSSIARLRARKACRCDWHVSSSTSAPCSLVKPDCDATPVNCPASIDATPEALAASLLEDANTGAWSASSSHFSPLLRFFDGLEEYRWTEARFAPVRGIFCKSVKGGSCRRIESGSSLAGEARDRWDDM